MGADGELGSDRVSTRAGASGTASSTSADLSARAHMDTPGRASRTLVTAVTAGSVGIVLVATFAIADASAKLPVLPGFNWAYATAYLITGLITAVLLMQATPETWSWSLAALTAGYVFAALMTVPFLLSFPGAFTSAAEPLLGGSPSAPWTFYLWHGGFLAFVLASTVLVRSAQRREDAPDASSAGVLRSDPPSRAVSAAVGAAAAAVIGVAVIAAGTALPDLLGPGLTSQKTTTFHVLSWSVVVLGLVTLAFAVSVARSGSQIRVWLVPVVMFTTFEAVQLPKGGRYSVGWYTPRTLAMVACTVLLVALLVQVWRQSKALARARAQAERLAQIVEQSPIGHTLVDPEGIVVEVNQALCDLTGYDRSELVGVPFDATFGSPDGAGPDIASLLGGQMRSLALRRPVTRRDGSAVWVDVVAHRMVDATELAAGVAVTVSDASGDVAVDLDPDAPVGTAVLSAEGVISHATEALCALVHRTREDLVGRPFAELVVPQDRDGDLLALDRIRRNETEVSGNEVRLVRDGADPLWATVYRSALRDARGAIVGYAVQVIDVDQRKRAEAAAVEARRFLEQRSTYDDLTGLLNRPTFVDRLQQALDDGASMAVLVVDIDRFRRVSNAMTRRGGDDVIVEMARRLAATVDERGMVARTGGDEFALAVPLTAGLVEQATDLAEQVRAAVADEPIRPTGLRLYLTCCVGVTIGRPGHAAADLMQEADLATREAKETGPSRFSLFDQRMRQALVDRLDLVERIRTALAAREFVAWYQPLVNLRDGSLVGYEALSRWITGEGTVIPPDQYLPVAEDSGLIVPIGGCTVDLAVAALSRLPEPLTIAVNASPTELLSGGFASHVQSALAQHGVPPERLIVEITEQALFDVGRAHDAGLTRLSELGVALHVDDFGTGYSSITHLRDFPIQGIKLDRSFTAQLDGDDSRAYEIAATLADLAGRLGLDSVAEGVETRSQADQLAALGWRHGQGWLYGRPGPLPADDGVS